MSEQRLICPHCGADLPQEATFCPHCAREISVRTSSVPPAPVWGKLRRWIIPVLILCAVLASVWMYTRPQNIDAVGEVIYNHEGTEFHLIAGRGVSRFQPFPVIEIQAEDGQPYRTPVVLYANFPASGDNAKEAFMELLESATIEVTHYSETDTPWVCNDPAPHDAFPEGMLVCLQDFYLSSGDMELSWVLKMKNGDTIRLRQENHLIPVVTHDFYPQEHKMDTIEDLQDLVNSLSDGVDDPAPYDVVNLHLPPVEYEGGLEISGRPLNLYGSTQGDQRTTFTGWIWMAELDGMIAYFDQLDIMGHGEGVGVSTASRIHLTNCRVSGWKTGVLCHGRAWVNIADSQVDHNAIGFHFNTPEGMVTHTLYTNNNFTDNGTAILLEQVPTDVSISLKDTIFQGNGVDIDNRCGQAVDTSQSIFK